MDGAGTYYYEEPVLGVGVLYDGDGGVARGDYGGFGGGGLGDFMLKEIGRCEWIDASN